MMKTMIDAGHGGRDSGVKVGDFVEKDLTLKMSLFLAGVLSSDSDVQFTRVRDYEMTESERISHANSMRPLFFISIHVGKQKEILIRYGDLIARMAAAKIRDCIEERGVSCKLKPDSSGFLKEINAVSIMVCLPQVESFFKDALELVEFCQNIREGLIQG